MLLVQANYKLENNYDPVKYYSKIIFFLIKNGMCYFIYI